MSRRTKVIIASAVLLLLLVLGLTGHEVQRVLSAESATDLAPPVRQASNLIGKAGELLGVQHRVVVLAHERGGERAVGMDVSVGGHWVRTDDWGTAELELPPGLHNIEVAEPWELEWPGYWPVWTDSLVELTVRRPCPGSYRVVDDQGIPLAGARIKHWDPAVAGPDGLIQAPDRECGTEWLSIYFGDSDDRLAMVGVEVVEPGIIDVVVPSPQHTVVWIVDGQGRPVTAEVEVARGDVDLQPLGGARYRLSGRLPDVTLHIIPNDPRFSEARRKVALGGDRQIVMLQPSREVRIEGDCLECPDELYCGPNRCSGSVPPYTCTCPGGVAPVATEANLYSSVATDKTVGWVPADSSQVTLDLEQGVGTIVGVWGPGGPCSARLEMRLSTTCEADGSFVLEEVPAGHQWVTVQAYDQGRTLEVDIPVGGVVDLGELEPADVPWIVQVQADFPLENRPLLIARPGGVAEHLGDGSFLFADRPPSPVMLKLWVWEQRGFTTWVDPATFDTWTLHAAGPREDPGLLGPEESSPIVDTANPSFDTGRSVDPVSDTAVPPLTDTGDTGDTGD